MGGPQHLPVHKGKIRAKCIYLPVPKDSAAPGTAARHTTYCLGIDLILAFIVFHRLLL